MIPSGCFIFRCLRRRQRSSLLIPCSVSGTFDAGECVVGMLSSGSKSFLRPTCDPPSNDFVMRDAMDAQEVAVGWWPGDRKHDGAAFYAFAHPAPEGFGATTLSPEAARWDSVLGEYLLDWADVCRSADPHGAGVEFAHSAFRHACLICGWDPALPASIEGKPPPVS